MTEENQNLDFITRVTQWYSKNEKKVTYVMVGLLVVVGAIYAYNWYTNKQNEEALEELTSIQKSFGQDSMDAILKGANGGTSAIDLADEYGGTKAGNLAKFYAGVAFFKKGDYETAMDYLKSFDAKGDPLLGPNRLGMIGDCYAALKNYEEAAEYFEDAGKENINDLTTPHWMFKAGAAYEKQDKYGKAVGMYEFIMDNCPKVIKSSQVEKYLNYAKGRAGQLTAK